MKSVSDARNPRFRLQDLTSHEALALFALCEAFSDALWEIHGQALLDLMVDEDVESWWLEQLAHRHDLELRLRPPVPPPAPHDND